MEFERNHEKALINQEKHGVTFEEAVSVFEDDDALLIYDPDHSENEDRFVFLGASTLFNLLIVCHCYRDSDNKIRIISARKATKTETKTYRARKNHA